MPTVALHCDATFAVLHGVATASCAWLTAFHFFTSNIFLPLPAPLLDEDEAVGADAAEAEGVAAAAADATALASPDAAPDCSLLMTGGGVEKGGGRGVGGGVDGGGVEVVEWRVEWRVEDEDSH